MTTQAAAGDLGLPDAIHDRSARGIAAAVGRMVSSERLPPGTRLPTVRVLARELGVSPTTVSEAWQALAAVGAIEARGRQGTFVRRPGAPGVPNRYRRMSPHHDHVELDLSTGTPDPDLLPDLRPIIARLSRTSLTTSYLDQPVLPALGDRLRADWPFVPGDLTVVDGAMDAVDRIAREVVRLGDRVVVEQPTFPPLLDLLEQVGAEPIGVELDDQGMIPASLADALAGEPAAILVQPRAQNPTGITTSAGRARALARAIAEADRRRGASTPTWVIEDDHSGDIATGPLVSLGRHLPDQTLLVRSFSKSHGPDLRLAAVGGAAQVVQAVANRRLLGAGWSSRILQAVLLGMLDDVDVVASIEHARREYARRRRLVSEVLTRRGVPVTGEDGINLWVSVADERATLVALAAQGIGVAPGAPFVVGTTAGAGDRPGEHPPHVRVTCGLLHGSDADVRATARLLADAAGLGAVARRSR
jgi:DNA-binding transcriptional MocR family regulator